MAYVTLNTNGGGGASNSVEPMEVDLATGSGLVPQYYLEVTITTSAEQLVYKYQGAGGYVSSETCADIKKFRDTYATNPAQILAIAGKLAEKAGKINPVGLVPSRSVEQLEVTTRGMSFQYSKTMENSSLQLDKIDSFPC
ncbi:hypothetical protein OS493_005211 [Desmophyllum pertusum]|uniref:Uncharacterized protein n=1 Tax=Desmophyllum pertusum TaxID=174260 RepID=A0A9W9Z6R4_9CNID|nr:hypothetical protein OS493_005211 [Desmophyllum pertusum]